MSKLYAIGAAILLGMSLIVSSYFYGMHVQKKKDEAVQTKSQLVDLQKEVSRALSIADEFSKIAKDFVAKMENVREVTKTITKTQVQYVDRYIKEHPEVAACTAVPAPVVQLRNCQIQRIRKAAGYAVSGSSDGAVCPSG